MTRWPQARPQSLSGLAQTCVPGSHIRLRALEAAAILLYTQQPCMSDQKIPMKLFTKLVRGDS